MTDIFSPVFLMKYSFSVYQYKFQLKKKFYWIFFKTKQLHLFTRLNGVFKYFQYKNLVIKWIQEPNNIWENGIFDWLKPYQRNWGMESSCFLKFFVKEKSPLTYTPAHLSVRIQVCLFACLACVDAYVHHGKRLMQHVSSINVIACRFIGRFKIWYFSHSHTNTHIDTCSRAHFTCSIV